MTGNGYRILSGLLYMKIVCRATKRELARFRDGDVIGLWLMFGGAVQSARPSILVNTRTHRRQLLAGFV